jgi:homoserine dehydrogenase
MDHDDAEMTTSEPDPEPKLENEPARDSEPEPQPEPAAAGPRIALLGLGTVGTAVAALLLDPEWQANVAARGHRVPTLAGVADLDLERDRGLDLDGVRQTTDLHELLEADDIDIVIELMGGTGVAGEAVLAAFAAGKSVVTANKDLVARRGGELENAAREADAALRFEAAVLAGVPVLGPLVNELGANRFSSLRGIFNGTTNHILSTMASDARDYDDVLREAQARGYAEADPSSDVEGFDAAYKLTILIRLAFGGWTDVDALRRGVPALGGEAATGISGVKRSHLSAAARLGMALKLVARAERDSADRVTGAVTPMAVAQASVLGATGGVTNIIELTADPIGRVAMAGPGAGGPATSSAILADVLALDEGAGSTWGRLPAADDLEVVDDLSLEHGWLVVVEGLGVAGFPDPVKKLALVSTDEGFVTQPISLAALTGRLSLIEQAITIYPVLSDA